MIIPHNKVLFTEDEFCAVRRVMTIGFVINGNKCRELELEWCKVTGAESAAMVSSGLSALRLALIALDVGKDDEVIIPAYSCVCLANSVLSVGAEYRLADIKEDLTINVENEWINAKLHRKAKAIIVVHTFGAYADIDNLKKLDIPIIEDFSHGIFQQKGILGICSFSPTKFLGSISGGIVSGSKELMDKVRDFSNYGDKKPSLRQNDSGSDISATIVIEKLKRLDEIKQKRLDAADTYNRLIFGKGMTSFPARLINKPLSPYRYVIRVSNAKTVSEKMKALGVQAELPIWQYQKDFPGLPNTEKAFQEVLSLPFYESITIEEQKKVVEVLNEVQAFQVQDT